MGDWVTQSKPDTFAEDILNGRHVKASFETIECYTVKNACVRTKDSPPYKSNPILPKRFKVPKKKMPEEIYGHGRIIEDYSYI